MPTIEHVRFWGEVDADPIHVLKGSCLPSAALWLPPVSVGCVSGASFLPCSGNRPDFAEILHACHLVEFRMTGIFHNHDPWSRFSWKSGQYRVSAAIDPSSDNSPRTQKPSTASRGRRRLRP